MSATCQRIRESVTCLSSPAPSTKRFQSLASWLHAGYHSIFAEFYDGNAAAWQKKIPPGDPTYTLTLIDLGGLEIKPGEFAAPPAK